MNKNNALLAALYALPENASAGTFLDELGFASSFREIWTDDDHPVWGPFMLGEKNLYDDGDGLDYSEFVPDGFLFLDAYETEDGPLVVSVKPRSPRAAWWLTAQPPEATPEVRCPACEWEGWYAAQVEVIREGEITDRSDPWRAHKTVKACPKCGFASPVEIPFEALAAAE